MARKQKLKVYRTPIGFHDAYVAAPSQKAALEAWGSDANLFARGVAELVDDDALTKEPLAKPGMVIKRARGSESEHIAALPQERPAQRRREPVPDDDDGPPPRQRSPRSNDDSAPRRRAKDHTGETRAPAPEAATAKKRSVPRPSRASLDTAEQALEEASAQHRTAIAEIRQREQELQQERRRLEKDHGAHIARLEAALEKARKAYGAALEKWRI